MNTKLDIRLIVGTIIILSLAWSYAYPKNLNGEYDNSPNKEWFESQHNSTGQWCCNEADGHQYDGDYTMNEDGSVSIGNDRIESYKVLKGPNPMGQAVWWYVEGPYGRTTFCFIPGAEG